MLALEEIVKAKSEGKQITLDDLGYTDHVGNTKIAGLAARDVYNNWGNAKWRNAFIMSVQDFCENQYEIHQKELHSRLAEGHAKVAKAARGAVLKSYLVEKSMKIEDYVRADGTHVGGYTRDGMRNHRTYASENMDQVAAMTAAMSAAYSQKVGGSQQQQVMYHIEDPQGRGRVDTPTAGYLPDLADGERVVRQTPVGFKAGPKDLGLGTVNLLQAMGMNFHKAGSAGAAVQHMSNVGQSDNWYKRLEAMSKVMVLATGEVGAGAVIGNKIGGKRGATIGAGIGTAAAVATALGEAVATHGPEVSRVLGPGIRKYAYRYRGQTTTPQQYSTTARDGRQTDGQGGKESTRAFESRLAFTLASTDAEKGGISAIPSKAENELLLKTGSTAPSQGFLLDSKGNVTQQAVGSGTDDHYVPFNLAKVHTLQGGSYVRTRVYGGPTTEDFSLAMRTGATRFSTISHNGSFTVQFDPHASTKKYGYTPKMVTARYGKLLDAIKHGKVNDPDTGQPLKLDERGYAVALQSLKRQFPLLIQSVSHDTPKDLPELGGQRGGEHEVDTGYVRPMYLKPSEARGGYYDELLNKPGESNQSYDQMAGYRSLKATRLLMAQQAARPVAAPVVPGQRPNAARTERTGGLIPSGVGQREGERAEMAGTDTGEAQVSYNIREDAWNSGHAAAMNHHMQGILTHYMAHLDGAPADPDAAEWLGIFQGAHQGDEGSLAALEKVRRGGASRGVLLETINEIMPNDTDDPGLLINMQKFQDGLIDEDEGNVEGISESSAAGVDSLERIKASKHFDDAKLHDTMMVWAKDPNLGEAKRKQLSAYLNDPVGPNDKGYDPGKSKADYWDDPNKELPGAHPDDRNTNLTPFEQFRNRSARVLGHKPMAPPKDREPVEAEYDSGVTDDMTDEEREIAANAWAEEEARKLSRLEDDDYS